MQWQTEKQVQNFPVSKPVFQNASIKRQTNLASSCCRLGLAGKRISIYGPLLKSLDDAASNFFVWLLFSEGSRTQASPWNSPWCSRPFLFLISPVQEAIKGIMLWISVDKPVLSSKTSWGCPQSQNQCLFRNEPKRIQLSYLGTPSVLVSQCFVS